MITGGVLHSIIILPLRTHPHGGKKEELSELTRVKNDSRNRGMGYIHSPSEPWKAYTTVYILYICARLVYSAFAK